MTCCTLVVLRGVTEGVVYACGGYGYRDEITPSNSFISFNLLFIYLYQSIVFRQSVSGSHRSPESLHVTGLFGKRTPGSNENS